MNKYNIGEVVYGFRINDDNYGIEKYIVTDFFYNSINEEYIYNTIGIDNDILTSTSVESSLYIKEDIEEAAIKALSKSLKAKNDFRCPITGGKIVYREERFRAYDTPSHYDVEGQNITWVTYPRDWKIGVYHSQGRIFDYLGNGTWEELFETKNEHTGKSIYTDLKNQEEIDNFLSERPVPRPKSTSVIKVKDLNIRRVMRVLSLMS